MGAVQCAGRTQRVKDHADRPAQAYHTANKDVLQCRLINQRKGGMMRDASGLPPFQYSLRRISLAFVYTADDPRDANEL